MARGVIRMKVNPLSWVVGRHNGTQGPLAGNYKLENPEQCSYQPAAAYFSTMNTLNDELREQMKVRSPCLPSTALCQMRIPLSSLTCCRTATADCASHCRAERRVARSTAGIQNKSTDSRFCPAVTTVTAPSVSTHAAAARNGIYPWGAPKVLSGYATTQLAGSRHLVHPTASIVQRSDGR